MITLSKLSGVADSIGSLFDFGKMLTMIEWAVVTLAFVVGGLFLSALQIDFTLFSKMFFTLSAISTVVVGGVVMTKYHMHDKLLIATMGALLSTNVAHGFLNVDINAPVADILLGVTTLFVLGMIFRMSKCTCNGTCSQCPIDAAHRRREDEDGN